MNLTVALLFVWRVYYIGPYYLRLLVSTLGYANDTTLLAKDLAWGPLVTVVLTRAFSFMLDLSLAVFVWPWPVEFCLARGGNPAVWRWRVGFRDKEIYVRRSRDWYRDLDDVMESSESREALLSFVKIATSPTLLHEKSGYLTMNAQWDLDWDAMCLATSLVDGKTLAMDAFRTLVLLYQPEQGWMCVETRADDGAGGGKEAEERRRQVFAFRDALASAGKEDLFFRWIEIIQFETSRPEGFGPEKQVEVAMQVRELFQKEGINFDEFWKEAVGADGLAGM